MPIYLKIDGIDGEVAAKGHEKWIEVLSWSWGETNQGSAPSGGGGGAGKVSFQDLHFVQDSQSSSPLLLQACATGKHIKDALLTFLKLDSQGSQGSEYLKIKLQDVLISSFQAGGAEGANSDRPSESISMNFVKIEWSYTRPGDTAPIVFAFDLQANR